MSVFESSKKIFLATKTINRVSQILSVFSKHGLSFFVEQSGLIKYLPIKSRIYMSGDSASIPVRARAAFEELGPVFVKLGQLISMREDIFNQDWIDAMRGLQDSVQSFPYVEVERILQSKNIMKEFSKIEEIPIASGSIAQVHVGYLLNGEKVAIKVRRPGIVDLVERDGLVLEFLAGVAEKQIPDVKNLGISRLMEEFIIDLKNELNFKIEAGYIERFTRNSSKDNFIKVPKVYGHLSDEMVLVEEFIEGLPFNKAYQLSQSSKDVISKNGLRSIMRMILKDGIFHGDLHGGNLFILPQDRIGLIDFGSVGVLSSNHRLLLISMLQHILKEEFEHVVHDFMEMSGQYGGVDTVGLAKDLQTTLSPWMGLDFEKVEYGKLLLKATQLASKNQIQIPSDWYLVFKAIANLESMARTLNPKFNFIQEAKDIGLESTVELFTISDLVSALTSNSQSLFDLFKMLPREIKWFVKFLEHNQYRIPIVVEHGEELNKIVYKIGRSAIHLLIGMFVILVTIWVKADMNIYFFGAGLGLGIFFILRSIRIL